MKGKSFHKTSGRFVFLIAGFLILFSASNGKAQTNSAECRWVWKWVWASEYNPATKQTELQHVYKHVFECPPIPTNTKSTSSTDGNSNSEKTTVATPDKTISSKTLKEGTYKINAKEGMFEETITFAIKIESVGADGEVKARVYKSGDEGQLRGRVEPNGQLLLEGSLIHVMKELGTSKYDFKLRAVVENDTLVKGKYHITFTENEWDGTFDKAILREP